MKRSALRRSPLRRHRRPSLPPVDLAARAAWKDPQTGFCECGCNRFSMHLHRHHVVLQQIVRREAGNEWALANSMLLHPDCHRRHHDCIRKIPVERVPVDALAFALDLLGEGGAAHYFHSRYGCEVTL